MNEILLRRRNKVLVPNGQECAKNLPSFAAMMKNIEGLGYTCSLALAEALLILPIEEQDIFYQELTGELMKRVGANVQYHPMYPGFPRQVMEMEEARLYWNALLHYLTDGDYYPRSAEIVRPADRAQVSLMMLDLGTEEELYEIWEQLLASPTSLSQTDQEDIRWLCSYLPDLNAHMPDIIPLKENSALVCSCYLVGNENARASSIQKYMKTATDVLRLAVVMSGGDSSLAVPVRFCSFRRRERRILLELLNRCGSLEEDMLRNKNRFIRLGESLHPREYSKAQYGRVLTAFERLRNDVKIVTFASKVEQAIGNQEIDTALNLLKQRPGELARRLDQLLRIAAESTEQNQKNKIIDQFQKLSVTVSTPVLLQVRSHFLQRKGDQNERRVFFPKGNLARVFCMENQLPPLDAADCDILVKICENALVEQYRMRDYMGRVYLSEEYRNYLVPFSQRSVSKAMKTVVRGSKIALEETALAERAFIWWTNTKEFKGGNGIGRVDLDLSAAIFDEDWNYLEHISYTNLRSRHYRACHSGDIVNGGPVDGEGVSEFLDVDLPSLRKCGARYVMFQVYSFTGQKFSVLPHAMFGWMARRDVNSGEIYEPQTVRQKIELTSDSTVCIPAIFDCVENQVIWCDMNLSLQGCCRSQGGNNVESNLSAVALAGYSLTNLAKPTLYDLILLNIRARGLRTEKKEEADLIFDLEEGITPYDLELFVSEYL